MVLHTSNHPGAPSMAEDQEKEEASFVEEVQTAEFELQKEEREDELVVATLLSAGGGSASGRRAGLQVFSGMAYPATQTPASGTFSRPRCSVTTTRMSPRTGGSSA